MSKQGTALFREWLNGLDDVLLAEAKRAGLSEHSGLTGDNRERILKNALRQFLPESLHIGKGKVIGTDSGPSRQVDIVIYDTRFPFLRDADNALYPVEGVVATIEVKSTLTTDELHDALENCKSVMTVSPAFLQSDAERWLAERTRDGKTEEDAFEELIWTLMPRTYVFAYDGMRKLDTFSVAMKSWLQSGYLRSHSRLFLPSVVVTGGVVGVARDESFEIRPKNAEIKLRPGQHVAMWSFESNTRFGILASHLLRHVEERTVLLETGSPLRRTIGKYLPFGEYIDDAVKDAKYSMTVWEEHEPPRLPSRTEQVAWVERSK
jgi:hypothetical protein